MQLKSVKVGWRGLDQILNRIIDAVNANEPVEGAGIRVHDGPGRGKIIEKADEGKQPSGSSGGNAANASADGNWMTVTIVDPDSCAASQIQVWARPVQ